MNTHLGNLREDDDFNTDRYLASTVFNRILQSMDAAGLNTSFSPRFSEHLEAAFNKTVVQYFVNLDRKAGDDVKFRYLFTLNDDKIYWNYGPAKKVKAGMESRLKQVRHVRDNILGINFHIVSYAATGIPVVLKFEQEQQVTVMDTFNDICNAESFWRTMRAALAATATVYFRLMTQFSMNFSLIFHVPTNLSPMNLNWTVFPMNLIWPVFQSQLQMIAQMQLGKWPATKTEREFGNS